MNTALGAILLIAAVVAGVPAQATVIPPWFDQNDFDYSFNGVLGRTDVDIVANAEPNTFTSVMQSLNIGPGRDWFVWIRADQTNQVALTSWSGITLNVPREQRFSAHTQLAFDTNSSPLGNGMPALTGTVLADGSLQLCVSSVTDPDCEYANTSQPNPGVNYTFFLKFGPVPEPATLALVCLGLASLGVAARRSGVQ